MSIGLERLTDIEKRGLGYLRFLNSIVPSFSVMYSNPASISAFATVVLVAVLHIHSSSLRLHACMLHARESGFMKGAWIKVLRIDKETGAKVMLLKYPKGFRAPKHTHSSDESGIVLEGKAINERGTEIKEGMYFFIAAGVEHGPMNVPEGCVLLIHSSGRK